MTPAHKASLLLTWATILCVAATAVAGDVLTAGAMRRIGDLDAIRARSGLLGAVHVVISAPMFLLGVGVMAVSFFTLLFTLSRVDVSLAAPSLSCTDVSGECRSREVFFCMRMWTVAVGSPLSLFASALRFWRTSGNTLGS